MQAGTCSGPPYTDTHCLGSWRCWGRAWPFTTTGFKNTWVGKARKCMQSANVNVHVGRKSNRKCETGWECSGRVRVGAFPAWWPAAGLEGLSWGCMHMHRAFFHGGIAIWVLQRTAQGLKSRLQVAPVVRVFFWQLGFCPQVPCTCRGLVFRLRISGGGRPKTATGKFGTTPEGGGRAGQKYGRNPKKQAAGRGARNFFQPLVVTVARRATAGVGSRPGSGVACLLCVTFAATPNHGPGLLGPCLAMPLHPRKAREL